MKIFCKVRRLVIQAFLPSYFFLLFPTFLQLSYFSYFLLKIAWFSYFFLLFLLKSYFFKTEWMSTKNIEHHKFIQFPHQISNGPPFTTYILGDQFCIFFVICIRPKTPTFVLLFYTFSYFIPTFPKILVLLSLSYFSAQGCQKACSNSIWRMWLQVLKYTG
jgi:hypothetical protein